MVLRLRINKYNNPRYGNIIYDLNRTRIGNSHLTHSYLITKYYLKPLCDLCNVPITITRITIDCPQYSLARHLPNNQSSSEEALN